MQKVFATEPRTDAVEHVLDVSDGAGEGARDDDAGNSGGGGGIAARSGESRVHDLVTVLQSG